MEQSWISVKVHPNAGKDVLVFLAPGRYEAWVKSKPVEGDANDAVLALLARALQMPARSIRLTKGHRGRNKLFRLTN